MRSGLAVAALLALCLVTSACTQEPATEAPVSQVSEEVPATDVQWKVSDPVAWRLAVVHSGDPSFPTGDALVAEFQELLDDIGSKTLYSQREIMDITVETWRQAQQSGPAASLLDTMRSLDASFTPGAANRGHDFDDIAASYLASLER